MKRIFVVALFAAAMMFLTTGALAQNSPDCTSITPQGGGTLTNSAGTWSWGAQNQTYPNDYAILLNGSEVGIGLFLEVANGGQLYMADNPGPSDWWLYQGGTSWSSTSQPSCGGGGVQPNGVSAPSGYHWTTTFDDEFTQDSSLNSVWNAGASNTDWCNVTFWGEPGGTYMFNEDSSNPCGANPGGLAFDSTNGLTMTSNGSPSGAIQTSNNFSQQYGFWEASIKIPTMSDGGTQSHSDFWMHPIPEGLGPRSDGQSNLVDWLPEIDVGERPTWTSNNNTQMYFGIHDYPVGSDVDDNYCGDSGGDDLSQNFHTYGLYWANDGSAYGSMQMYIDGAACGGWYTLNSSDSNMANGIYMFLSLDNDANDSSNPFVIQYVRVWTLNSN